ncbi:tetratricopeptide repeat protein [Paenibacillus thiaminolyticus]|uniref:tetratricopeptide repeat protein n=1 Tax=Paenibacillus thiaminolyticus TaxID=49283 RepID=UPI00116459D6|nr:tetratricopeptide repeat protein [Paenibacillus thiaminolyticus]NGP60280.1 tetratricopeptide repeat protein [Paenibacillus thiaminolyticus]
MTQNAHQEPVQDPTDTEPCPPAAQEQTPAADEANSDCGREEYDQHTIRYLQQAIQRINQLYQRQEYQEALREAMQLQLEYPEHPTIMSLAAVVHKPVDPDKALDWAGEALRRDIYQPDAWRVRMGIYYDRGEWVAFETAARQLIAMAPDDPTPHLLLAQHQMRKGALEQAVLSLERCIDIEPAGLAYATYSYVLAQLDRTVESKEAERQALAMEEEHAYTLMQLAWAADQRGEKNHSLRLMEKAVRLDPDDSQVREEYMETLQKVNLAFRLVWLPAQWFQKLSPWILFVIWVLFAYLKPVLLVAFVLLHVSTHWISRWYVNWKVYGRPWAS